MRLLTKALIWFVAIAALIGLYFFSNIKGYYRFKEICEKEGGLKVYQPLEKGVGWQTLEFSGASSAKYLLELSDGIEYVRFRTAKGEEFDLKRKSQARDSFGNPSYEEIPSNSQFEPRYVYAEQQIAFEDLPRTQHYKTTIAEASTKKILVQYQDFVYRPFTIDWGYGAGMACSMQDKPTDQQPNRAREDALLKAFANK